MVNVRQARDAVQHDGRKRRALRATAPVYAGRDQRGDARRGEQLGDQGTFQDALPLRGQSGGLLGLPRGGLADLGVYNLGRG